MVIQKLLEHLHRLECGPSPITWPLPISSCNLCLAGRNCSVFLPAVLFFCLFVNFLLIKYYLCEFFKKIVCYRVGPEQIFNLKFHFKVSLIEMQVL